MIPRRRRPWRPMCSSRTTSACPARPASSCKGGESKADPTFAQPLAALESVDDAHAGIVHADGLPRVRVPVAPDDPSKGAAEPTVVVVEFSDFQCPHCGRAAEAFDELAAAY